MASVLDKIYADMFKVAEPQTIKVPTVDEVADAVVKRLTTSRSDDSDSDSDSDSDNDSDNDSNNDNNDSDNDNNDSDDYDY